MLLIGFTVQAVAGPPELRDNQARSALVTRVVDGDTFDAEVSLLYATKHTGRFRLLGVDAPETTGLTRDAGLAAEGFVTSLLLGKTVIVVGGAKRDSFGRWLVTVEVDGSDLGEKLVAQGHAVRKP